MRLMSLLAALALALFIWFLDLYDRAQAGDISGGSTYCEMVEIWKDQARAGVPASQRYGWPPRGVAGRDFQRDCGGDA